MNISKFFTFVAIYINTRMMLLCEVKMSGKVSEACALCQVMLSPSTTDIFYYCPRCRAYFCKTCIASIITIPLEGEEIKEDYSSYLGIASRPQTLICPLCNEDKLWLEKT